MPLFSALIAWLATLIIGIISATGYLGVALLMGIESACIPLPSEIIMPFAGSLVPGGRFTLWGLATAGALGCNIGSTLAYYVGAWGGRPAVDRWGRYLLLSRRDLDWSQRFFEGYGGITVLLCRLLPIVRTFIALPAGIARMPMLPFQIYTFVGSWPWCFGLAYVGARLGQAWESDPRLREVLHRFDFAIVGIVVVAAAAFIWHRLHSVRRA